MSLLYLSQNELTFINAAVFLLYCHISKNMHAGAPQLKILIGLFLHPAKFEHANGAVSEGADAIT